MNKRVVLFLNSKKLEYILLSIVFLAGFLVRLYKIDNPIADWHSWRQADTASVTRIYIERGIDLLKPRFNDISSIQSRIFNPEGFRMVEFPIYNAITATLVKNIDKFSLEVWSRLVTIFFSLISAYILFLIGKRFLGFWGGMMSSFFYLFIPFNIYFSRVILPDPMGVTFGLGGLLVFVRFIDSNNKAWLYLASFLFALMMLVKPYLGFYFIPALYLAIEKYGSKNILKKPVVYLMVTFLIISLTPFVLWRVWEQRFPEGIPLFLWAFNGNHIRFRPAYWNWVFGERIGHLILGSFGVFPFVFGLLPKPPKTRGASFIRWFFIGVLVYLVLVASANVMHDYYQIITIPAISLVLASGVTYLFKSGFDKKLVVSTLGLSILVMLVTGWYQVKPNYIINHPEIIEAGRALDGLVPKDALVVAPYNGDTAFLYQTGRSGWPVVDNSIENIIAEGADYYVSVDLNSTDTKNFEKKFPTIVKTDKYIILKLH